jgi:hypothetical protein|eukprot:g8201.t1
MAYLNRNRIVEETINLMEIKFSEDRGTHLRRFSNNIEFPDLSIPSKNDLAVEAHISRTKRATHRPTVSKVTVSKDIGNRRIYKENMERGKKVFGHAIDDIGRSSYLSPSIRKVHHGNEGKLTQGDVREKQKQSIRKTKEVPETFMSLIEKPRKAKELPPPRLTKTVLKRLSVHNVIKKSTDGIDRVPEILKERHKQNAAPATPDHFVFGRRLKDSRRVSYLPLTAQKKIQRNDKAERMERDKNFIKNSRRISVWKNNFEKRVQDRQTSNVPQVDVRIGTDSESGAPEDTDDSSDEDMFFDVEEIPQDKHNLLSKSARAGRSGSPYRPSALSRFKKFARLGRASAKAFTRTSSESPALEESMDFYDPKVRRASDDSSESGVNVIPNAAKAENEGKTFHSIDDAETPQAPETSAAEKSSPTHLFEAYGKRVPEEMEGIVQHAPARLVCWGAVDKKRDRVFLKEKWSRQLAYLFSCNEEKEVEEDGESAKLCGAILLTDDNHIPRCFIPIDSESVLWKRHKSYVMSLCRYHQGSTKKVKRNHVNKEWEHDDSFLYFEHLANKRKANMPMRVMDQADLAMWNHALETVLKPGNVRFRSK